MGTFSSGYMNSDFSALETARMYFRVSHGYPDFCQIRQKKDCRATAFGIRQPCTLKMPHKCGSENKGRWCAPRWSVVSHFIWPVQHTGEIVSAYLPMPRACPVTTYLSDDAWCCFLSSFHGRGTFRQWNIAGQFVRVLTFISSMCVLLTGPLVHCSLDVLYVWPLCNPYVCHVCSSFPVSTSTAQTPLA